MPKGSIKALNSKLDVQALLKELNSALSEEWLAFYQYWIGAQVVVGFNRPEVEAASLSLQDPKEIKETSPANKILLLPIIIISIFTYI